MLKLTYVTPSQSIKNGPFETWVLVVVSTVKAVGAEPALPSYMYQGGVNVSTTSSSFSNKIKGKGKEKMRRMMKVILITRPFSTQSFSTGMILN
jgi:hypothetical protein